MLVNVYILGDELQNLIGSVGSTEAFNVRLCVLVVAPQLAKVLINMPYPDV